MADYNANIAPFINEVFYITSEFGEERETSGGGIRYHNGLDIATPSSQGNVDLFSVCNGEIIHYEYEESGSGFGNFFIIKDKESDLAFLYAHLDSLEQMSIGTDFEIGQFVGTEGTTGSSTGIHLHFAIQNLSGGRSWNFNASIDEYINPAEWMGVPNIEGISIYYDGIPKYKKKKRGFPWVLYAKKLRNRGKIY